MSQQMKPLSLSQVIHATADSNIDYNSILYYALKYASMAHITAEHKAQLYKTAAWALDKTERPLRAIRCYREGLKLARATRKFNLAVRISLALAALLARHRQVVETEQVLQEMTDYLAVAHIPVHEKLAFTKAAEHLRQTGELP